MIDMVLNMSHTINSVSLQVNEYLLKNGRIKNSFKDLS